ncbi:MAG: glycosyltransferase family 39 protein [Burkholderiaceae bacterium]
MNMAWAGAAPAPSSRLLWLLALAAAVARLSLGLTFPITGDEALFVDWGRQWAGGYYDHPPMVGWWLALIQSTLGDALWAVRLPAMLLPLALAWVVADMVRTVATDKAAWALLLVLCLPWSWWYIFVTTDTPLLAGALLAVWAWGRAQPFDRPSLRGVAWYALVGVGLAVAWLSKYFAVLLAVGLALQAMHQRRWWAMGVVALVCLPAVAWHVVWNMTHGWATVMFNVFNRNQDAAASWQHLPVYALSWVYWLTPALAWVLWRHRRAAWAELRHPSGRGLPLLAPVLLLGVVALATQVGPHWFLAFYPLALVWAVLALPLPALRRACWGVAAFTLLHAVVVVGLTTTSLNDWRDTPWYPKLVRSYRTAELVAQVDAPGTVLMTTGYTASALYGYALGRHVPVFGVGSKHGRHDDLFTDYRAFNGATVRVLSERPLNPVDYAPFFAQIRRWQISQDGVEFEVLEGTGFNAEVYRQRVLQPAYQTFHRIPAWLPVLDDPLARAVCGQPRCAGPTARVP